MKKCLNVTASIKLLQRSLILKPSKTLTGSNSRYYQKIFEASELCSEVAIGVHYKLIRINQRWLPQQQKLSAFQSQQKRQNFLLESKMGWWKFTVLLWERHDFHGVLLVEKNTRSLVDMVTSLGVLIISTWILGLPRRIGKALFKSSRTTTLGH